MSKLAKDKITIFKLIKISLNIVINTYIWAHKNTIMMAICFVK